METNGREGERPSSLPAYDIVAIASSAGGLNALSVLLAALPADFPAAIAIVQHLSPRHPSLLADILGRRTAMPVRQAVNGDILHRGRVYIAPPDEHLLINPGGIVSLAHTELVHFSRPSADLLFESVAASFQERAIAVVLTGAGSDGAIGIRAVKKMGGRVLAQDEATAEYFGMPWAAIQTGDVDWVLPLSNISPMLIRLVNEGDTR